MHEFSQKYLSLSLVLVVLIGGCRSGPSAIDRPSRDGKPQETQEPIRAPATTQPSSATPTTMPSPADTGSLTEAGPVAIRVREQPILHLNGATVTTDGQSLAYQLFVRQPATRPAEPMAGPETSYLLSAKNGDGPTIRCTIDRRAEPLRISIRLSSETQLPTVVLHATLAEGVVPIRLDAPLDRRTEQFAVGPAVYASFNGLYRRGEPDGLALLGGIRFRTSWPEVGLDVHLQRPSTSQATVLILAGMSLPDGPSADTPERLTTRPGESQPVASFAACAQPDANDTDRLVAWIRENLAPFGVRAVWSVSSDAAAHALALENRSCDALTEALRDHAYFNVGTHTPVEQLRRDATWHALTRDDLILDGPIEAWTAERVEVMRRICPPVPIRRVDVAPARQPRFVSLAVATPFDAWNLVGVFNDSNRSQTRDLELRSLGLPIDEPAYWAVYDFWNEQLLAVARSQVRIHLPARSCRALAIRRVHLGQPTLISTSRHITQGLIDLRELSFDPDTLTMRGISEVVAGDPYELRFLVGWNGASFEIADVRSEATASYVRAAGPLLIVTLESDTTRELPWEVRFVPGRRELEPLESPRNLTARQNTRGVALRWDGREDQAVTYRIYRNDEPVAEVAARQHAFQDSGVRYDRMYTYTVTASDFAGRESAHSPPVRHRTPIPANTHLTRLEPVRINQGSEPGVVRFDRSAAGRMMRSAGRRYSRGVSMTPGTRVTYFVGSGYATFSGEIGIDDASDRDAAAVFEVFADEELVYQSPVLRKGDRPRRILLSIADRRLLTLAVSRAGEGNTTCHADWGDTYLRVGP